MAPPWLELVSYNNMPVSRKKHAIDATGQTPGRLATQVATLLMGKHRPDFDPSRDLGDMVEISNASRMRYTGRKLEQKLYQRHTGYPGGVRTEKLSDLAENEPSEVLRRAIRGMLPKNRLQDARMKRLTISD